MIQTSPKGPYLASTSATGTRRLSASAASARVSKAMEWRVIGKTGGRVSASDILRAFTRSRAHMFMCVHEIFNKWCRTDALLLSVIYINELTGVLVNYTCWRTLSLLAQPIEGGVV